MKEFTVTAAESGQKCLKYCEKVLPGAGTGFLHKMLRKKNITLNGKKADGSERLTEGDVVRFFFSDETFSKFSSQKAENPNVLHNNIPSLDKKQILYEDEHILLYNKPVGVLSQKAKPEDVSLNEMLLAYLQQKNASMLSRASICNRLDRNTSGIVICGKTYQGLRAMNELIAGREVGKYYHCLVAGKVSKPILLRGYLRKNEQTNQVEIRSDSFEGASYIETELRPLASGKEISLLEVHLITGKTHQIRSHLAYLGHAILGDYKYGNRQINDKYKQKYGIKSQMLHAHRLVFPKLEGTFAYLSEKEFTAPKPVQFARIEKEEIHGYMEVQRP